MMTCVDTKQSQTPKVPRRPGHLPLILLALTFLGVSLYAFVTMRNDETSRIEEAFKQTSQIHFTIIEKEIERQIAKLTSLSYLYAASENITREEFKNYIESFEPGLTQNIRALEWVPKIFAKDRSAFEDVVQKDGFPGFRITELNRHGELVPAGVRDEYYPVYYLEPHAGNEAAFGFDLASEESRRDAMLHARDTGQFAATLKATLVQDQGTTPGIIAFYPVYRRGAAIDTIAERRQHLEGFVAGVSNYGSLASQLFDILKPLDIDHYVFTQPKQQASWSVNYIPSTNRKTPIEPVSTPDTLRINLFEEESFRVGQVKITFIAKPAPGFFANRRGMMPWLIPGIGLAFFLAIMSYISVQTNRLTLLQQFNAEQAIANEKLAEANRELEAFVYTVSHDLRSPMTPILCYAEMLQEGYKEKLDDQALDFLEEIQTQGNRMMALMEDLLTLAKVGHLERPQEPVNVYEVVQQVQNNLASSIASANIDVRIGELPNLKIPEALLTQLFDNLIGNAIRYAGEQGNLIEVGGKRSEQRVQFFVRDHGPGIPEEERARIFETFFRGSTGKSTPGTGIGLATVKKITKLYGGSVWVEETPGGGATFFVELDD